MSKPALAVGSFFLLLKSPCLDRSSADLGAVHLVDHVLDGIRGHCDYGLVVINLDFSDIRPVEGASLCNRRHKMVRCGMT